MGIFQEVVEVVVRVARPLNLRFDGQDMKLLPNYNEIGERIEGVQNMIPRQCIWFALEQNVRMGTEDALDPTRYESLVGIVDPKERKKKSWHDISFIEEDAMSVENMTRVNLRELLEDDPQVTDIKVRGRKQDAGVKLPANENGAVLPVRGRG